MTLRAIEILDPGPLTTVQDLGRPGLAAWGVGRSGAADRLSAARSNRLLANPADAAMLELTLGGLRLRVEATLVVALTGAPAPMTVDGVPMPGEAPVFLAEGALLEVGRPPVGLRSYLAVRGGIDVAPVLGSRSRDVLARLGPAPLAAGDRLPVGPAPALWPNVDVAPVAGRFSRWGIPGRPVELAGAAGPHADAAGPDGLERLGGTTWSVGAGSDRTGVRLEGDGLWPARSGGEEWPVEGLVRGAIQLPPGGGPVVMLADHPVTGGYPAIGVLDEVDCDLAAQLRPGDQVRLRLRSPAHPTLRPGAPAGR